jgi:hypothetical protein
VQIERLRWATIAAVQKRRCVDTLVELTKTKYPSATRYSAGARASNRRSVTQADPVSRQCRPAEQIKARAIQIMGSPHFAMLSRLTSRARAACGRSKPRRLSLRFRR